MKNSFYLSHPRKGDVKNNLKKADKIAQRLKDSFELVEPFKELPQDGSLEEHEAMKRCIELLLDCDGIIMCGDWRYSDGCKLEYEIAKATRKIVFVYHE